MSSERKLVLLPVDGSDESMEVAKYISKAVNLTNPEGRIPVRHRQDARHILGNGTGRHSQRAP